MLETAATPSTFSQLRVIELDLLFAPNNALDAVINNLHNAPGLKRLTLKDARRIGFNELEMIHSQAPNLEYLNERCRFTTTRMAKLGSISIRW